MIILIVLFYIIWRHIMLKSKKYELKRLKKNRSKCTKTSNAYVEFTKMIIELKGQLQ